MGLEAGAGDGTDRVVLLVMSLRVDALSLIATAMLLVACSGPGSSAGPTTNAGTEPLMANHDAGTTTVEPGATTVEPGANTEWTLDGEQVDQPTFERTFGTLDVDPEPWVNRHLTNSEGSAGTSATYEARDRTTGALWTYTVRSIDGRSSRSLERGSRKTSTPARQ